jgi:hypothetical protein
MALCGLCAAYTHRCKCDTLNEDIQQLWASLGDRRPLRDWNAVD